MKKLNYKSKYQELLENLPERTRDVISRRFGLGKKDKETLEAIGESYGVCRERIRQIENAGLETIKEEVKNPSFVGIFQDFKNYLRKKGGLEKENILLDQFNCQEEKNEALFWLALGNDFTRFSETKNLYSLWTVNSDSVDLAKDIIDQFVKRFNKKKELISQNEVFNIFQKEINLNKEISSIALISYLKVSKKIGQSSEGSFGLRDWSEVTPRGIKDKAYLALKKKDKPLHFREVAESINNLGLNYNYPALPQTVHNELIRDQRFVLVGRGIYALKEWGFSSGQVKDVILSALKESKKPLSKEEIIKKVLSQRMVKENTVLLNLQNKEYFEKDPKGKYTIKEG
jgi:hypothetical protein